MNNLLLDRQASLLLIVDIQEKLAPSIGGVDGVLRNTVALIEAAGRLAVPILITEQYRKGLGPTVAPVASAAGEYHAPVFEKTHFNATREADFHAAVTAQGRRDIILCGTEAHVCVLQTALGLLQMGLRPVIAADAVGSRKIFDRDRGLERLRDAGILLATTEMVIFEWLERAGTETFRDLLPVIRQLNE